MLADSCAKPVRYMLPESSSNFNQPLAEIDVEKQMDSLEQHLASLQRQVEQLQRLAALGTMSAMLAHEFNNLLTPIISYSQYALQSKDPGLMKTAVEKTYQNAQRLATLCSRVLGMAADDEMGPADTPIRSLVMETVACLGRDLGKDDITLNVDLPEELKVRVRPSGLQQVLFNLIVNARQAMLDRPGSLTIVGRDAPNGRVTITIADTGRGIKAEHLDRVFEPFFTTKQHENRPDRRGIGLGLHICRQLIEEQGGEIAVQSKVGVGTTFTLTLPGAA